MTRTFGQEIRSLLLWYLPVFIVQFISGRVTVANINPWYQALEKASWNPPSWVFGPVWTILYIMMAVAAWMVYRTEDVPSKKFVAYTLFFLQLTINGLWSVLFFGLHMIGWALVDLGLLLVLVFTTLLSFYRINRLAGLLLAPYLLWGIYAFTLNAAIWWLNNPLRS